MNELICYMAVCELTSGVYRGGLLTVDTRGRPKDFRCTSAIRPNAMQRILYGNTLPGHVAVDLCGTPLLEAMPVSPHLFVVQTPDLQPLRKQTDIPLLWMRRQAADSRHRAIPTEPLHIIASERGLYEALVVSCPSGCADDIGPGANLLQELGSRIDPLEPFDRIKAALQLVQDKPAPR